MVVHGTHDVAQCLVMLPVAAFRFRECRGLDKGYAIYEMNVRSIWP